MSARSSIPAENHLDRASTREWAGRRRKLLLALAAMAAGGLVGLLLAEVLLRFFWPGGNAYYLWPPYLTVTFHPAPGIVHGVGRAAQIRVNSKGVLGEEWGADRAHEFRILAVGGSTTQNIMIDQSRTWPRLVQNELGKAADGKRVWVGNLGRSGFNSRDHLGTMSLAIGQYDVDMILMLMGGNDLMDRLMQGDRYDTHFIDNEDRYEGWLLSRFVMIPLAVHGRTETFYRHTALFQLARWVKSLGLRRKLTLDNDGMWLATAREYRRKGTLLNEMPRLGPALDEYGRITALIAGEARRHSLRIVFLTQPTFWKAAMTEAEQRLIWMGHAPNASGQPLEWPYWESGDGRMYSTAVLEKAMALYNQRLLDTCAKMHVECFDLASRVPRTLEMYFDDMHHTEAGSRLIASEVAQYLESREPFQSVHAPPDSAR